jgi:hypothetical protein
VLEKHSESPAEEDAEKSEGLKKTPTEGEEEEKEDSSSEQTETVDETKPVPYDRFREVNEAKATYEARVKELEPLAEAQRSVVQFCQENEISEQDFKQGMEFLRLVKTDPAEAKKLIAPVWEQLSSLTGDSLPKDLQQKVDDGILPLEYAKEIAALRGQKGMQVAKTQMSTQQLATQRQQAFVQSLQSAVKNWSDAKNVSDPDFKPKSGPNSPDGKYEFFGDRFYKLMVQTPPKSVADAVKLAEQAYGDVAKTFSGFVRRPATPTKGVSSTKSSTTTSTKDPKSIDDVVNGVLARHRR